MYSTASIPSSRWSAGSGLDTISPFSLTKTSGEILFDKLIATQLNNGHSENQKHPLRITVNIASSYSSVSPRKDLHIEVTDECDPFLLLSLRITEDDFSTLKTQQGLLVDFAAFPKMLVQLLERCIAEEQALNSPKFILILKINLLEIVETNPFKHLCHLALPLQLGNDSQIKNHLTKKFRLVKEENERLNECLCQLEQKLETEKKLTVQKTAELENFRANFNTKLSQVEEKLNLSFQSERQRLIQNNLDLEQRFEREKLLLQEAHRREVAEFEQKFREAENQNRDLLDKKKNLEASLREARNQLNDRETEILKLREELNIARQRSANLDSDYHDKERSALQLKSRLAACEQELKEKDYQISKQQEMLKNTQEAKARLEAEAEQRAALVTRRENAVKALTDELLKANEIIRKLQNELKAQTAKVKVRTEVASEQEKLLSQKDEELRQIRNELRKAVENAQTLQRELEEKEIALNTTKERTEQLEKQLKSDENIISWLNKQLNDVQLGRPATGSPATAATVSNGSARTGYPFASTPSSELQPLSSMPVSTVRKPTDDNRERDAPLDPVYYQPIAYGAGEYPKTGGILPVDRIATKPATKNTGKPKPSAYFPKK